MRCVLKRLADTSSLVTVVVIANIVKFPLYSQ